MSEMQSRHSGGVHGKHLQAASTRTGRSWSASSSSGDGEDDGVERPVRVARVARHRQEDGE